LQAVGAVLIPVVVAGLAFALTHAQSRSNELLKVRLDNCQALAPDRNRLMAHDASLRDSRASELIAETRPIIAGLTG
jgi:hypothetical protein